MNAPQTSTDGAPIQTIARNILAGDFPKTDAGYYTESEWTDAAQVCVDGDGYTDDLTHMLNMEATAEEYQQLPERRQDEWMGLENYFAALPVKSPYLMENVA